MDPNSSRLYPTFLCLAYMAIFKSMCSTASLNRDLLHSTQVQGFAAPSEREAHFTAHGLFLVNLCWLPVPTACSLDAPEPRCREVCRSAVQVGLSRIRPFHVCGNRDGWSLDIFSVPRDSMGMTKGHLSHIFLWSVVQFPLTVSCVPFSSLTIVLYPLCSQTDIWGNKG